MRTDRRLGLLVTMLFTNLYGCEDPEAQTPQAELGAAGGPALERDDEVRAGASAPRPSAPADKTPQPSSAAAPPRTEVPDPLVGAWESSPIDFALWENYRTGQYAGRNAAPSREAMVFRKDGAAKFYRYEFAFTLYEELIDCEGTVVFRGDGTFTFYPVRGRKRFNDMSHSERTVDRALTDAELTSAELAGTRSYMHLPSSQPEAIQITVPSSAPYKWYRKP